MDDFDSAPVWHAPPADEDGDRAVPNPPGESPEAFRLTDELAREHMPGVLRFLQARFFRQNPEAAHDALQETFSRAVRSQNTLKKPEHFKGWLYTIAVASARDLLRKDYQRCSYEINSSSIARDDDDTRDVDELVSPEEAYLRMRMNPLSHIIHEEAMKMLRAEAKRNLEGSPPNPHLHNRIEFAMSGKTREEFAKMLGVSINGLEQRFTRALRDARRVLQIEHEYELMM